MKPKVNPYQEFQDAFDAGKVIQCRLCYPQNGITWNDINGQPAFNLTPDCYRVKLWSLDDIKTERELRPGEEWRTCALQTFEEDDLPTGYRPLLEGELVLEGDEVKYGRGEWSKSMNFSDPHPTQSICYLYRTTRPLPLTPEEQTRKDFETWAVSVGYNVETDNQGYYWYQSTRSAYEGYVAGQKSMQSS